MKTKLIVVALVVALASWFMFTPTAFSTAKMMSDAGKKACTDCHVKTGSKDLNDAGKAFKAEMDKKAPAKK